MRVSNGMTTKVLSGLASTTLIFGLIACSDTQATDPGASLGDMTPTTLRVTTLYGPDHWQTKPLMAYTDAVERDSGGKITFEYFYGASLLQPPEMADGIRDGLADLGVIVPVYTADKFPVDNWISALSFVPEQTPVAGTLQAAAATLDWGLNTPSYMDDFAKQGLTPLLPRLQATHTYDLLCKDQATTLDELKGKKVRIGGAAWSEEAKNLDMVPVSLAGDEVYTGFQRGVVDCFMGGPPDMLGLKLWEIGKNFTAVGFPGFSSFSLVIGSEKWASLPVAARQLMWDDLPVYLKALFESNMQMNLDFVKGGQSRGITFSVADNAVLQKVASYESGVLSAITSKAPSQVSDPSAVVQAYVKAHDDWFTKVKGLDYPADVASWAKWADTGAGVPDLKAWADAVGQDVLAPHRPK